LTPGSRRVKSPVTRQRRACNFARVSPQLEIGAATYASRNMHNVLAHAPTVALSQSLIEIDTLN